MAGKGDIKLNGDATVAVMNHGKVLVVTGLAADPVTPGISPVEFQTVGGSGEYMPWGSSNNFPDSTRTKIYKNSIIPAVLSHRTNSIYSGGWYYGILKGYKEIGGEYVPDFEPLIHPDVEDFLGNNDIPSYVHESIKDLLTWNHAMGDMALNDSRTYIGSLSCQDMMFFRFGPADKETGRIAKGVLDGNFAGANSASVARQIVDLVETSYNPLKKVREGSAKRYLYPVTIYSHGRSYYQDAAWQSILATKWLDVAEKISQFKSFLIDNQMTLKYVIHVPLSYWKWKYPHWEDKKEMQETWRTETLTSINENLTGVEKVGKTVLLTFKDGFDKSESTKWEIQEMMGLKGMDGALLEDSAEASSHIYAAFAFNHTITGNSPGKQLGGGSGSDIRVAHNVDAINMKVYMDWVLKPLNFISLFNGWKYKGFPIQFIGKSTLITTLNTGKETGSTTNAAGAKTQQ